MLLAKTGHLVQVESQERECLVEVPAAWHFTVSVLSMPCTKPRAFIRMVTTFDQLPSVPFGRTYLSVFIHPYFPRAVRGSDSTRACSHYRRASMMNAK